MKILYLARVVRSEREICPLKVRVGANSPSLCPTIFSVMNSGTWRRPSCTAIVSPSMSGIIVDARDHVRITVRLRLFCADVTFLASFGCTYGPFLVDLDIFFPLPIHHLPMQVGFASFVVSLSNHHSVS